MKSHLVFNLLASLMLAASNQLSAATFTVTTTADSGAGSLRQAILDANGQAAGSRIEFNISGAGPYTIRPTSALPTISRAMTIDANTQPGFAGQPIVEISGSLAGTSAAGLTISAGSTTVRGLVINGFSRNALVLQTLGNNTIQGNYFGVNRAGDTAVINGATGWSDIYVSGSPDNLIGGTNAGDGNVISGCGHSGISIEGVASAGTRVQGNLIGTDRTGRTAIGNSYAGITIYQSPLNTIGGTASGARNIISGNAYYGITVHYSSSVSNIIQGNYIGTDLSGRAALGNANAGVRLLDCNYNQIGGTNSGAGNVISGNRQSGVLLEYETLGASMNLIRGNIIGADATGTNALGNWAVGILINSSAGYNNVIGGTAAGAANIVAFNGADGINILGASTGNQIRGNAIFDNAGLGIDLWAEGVTPNDAGDADAGANNLQNYPVLSAAAVAADGTIKIMGALNSRPNLAYALDFFASPNADGSGYGEGRRYLGSVNATTAASGNASFSVIFTNPVFAGGRITATATDPGNNTSEFSLAIAITTNRPPMVVLNSPSNAAVYLTPATLALTATASDPDGQISRVEFYANSSLLGFTTTAPYSFTWSNVPPGAYSLSARATDDCGMSAASSVVTVTVFPAFSVLPGARIAGLTQAEWTAEWWKWAYRLPATGHPLFDTAPVWTGQSGPVWFLGGKFCLSTSTNCNPQAVTRTATVPEGKYLFFPVINAECSTAEGNGTNETELAGCVVPLADLIANLSYEVDGVLVTNLAAYRQRSPLFTFTVASHDNVLREMGYTNVADGASSLCVSDGYYVMLNPLSAGTHTLRFHGEIPAYNFTLDATYTIEVAPAVGFGCSSNQLVLSWNEAAGYVLQVNDNLGDPAGWRDVPAGTNYPVVIPMDSARKFYRLKK